MTKKEMNVKNKILENPIIFYEYKKIIKNLNKSENMKIFVEQDISIIMSKILLLIIETLPINYNIEHLEKITTIENVIKIMKQLNPILTVENQVSDCYIENIPNSITNNNISSINDELYDYQYNPNEKIIMLCDHANTIINNNENNLVIDMKVNDKINLLQREVIKLKTKLPSLHNKYFDMFSKLGENSFLWDYMKIENCFYGMIEELKIWKFTLFYAYALLLLYFIKIYEYSSKIMKNKEIYQIYCNLKKADMKTEYISNKMYDLYNTFYVDVFKYRLKDYEMKLIIHILEQKQLYSNFEIKEYEVSDIELEVNPDLNSKEKIKIFSKFLISFYEERKDRLNIFEAEKIEYLSIYIIKTLKDNFNILEIFMLMNNLNILVSKIMTLIESQKLQNERKRLLNGDLSKEVEIKKQELEYNSVQNGYEFEEYVANLYKKLGYTIEEVTKKSGDQGADVIAYKNNIKYVIQVKFYNNPVGNKAVQEIVAAKGMYNAKEGLVVTNSTFTNSAIKLANANDIELIDGEKLEELKKYILNEI